MDKLWRENLFLECITLIIQDKMRHIYLYLIMSMLQLYTLNAQTCQKTFIEKLKAIWPSKIEQFNNQIKGLNEDFVTQDRDSVNIIYVPQLLYHKNVKYGMKMEKEDFFCMLNPESMRFYEALIKYKQQYLFLLSTTGKNIENVNTYSTKDKKNIYEVLFSLINKYQSDYLFTIFNCYYIFLVKNDQILAFDYFQPEKEIDINKIIKEIISNPLLFRYYEPIEIICD